MKCSICVGPCKASMPHRVGHIRQTITHNNDNPITPFVLICRAIEEARNDGSLEEIGMPNFGSGESISTALYEEMTSRGWIVADEDAHEEGWSLPSNFRDGCSSPEECEKHYTTKCGPGHKPGCPKWWETR